jgi:hypothetical protein
MQQNYKKEKSGLGYATSFERGDATPSIKASASGSQRSPPPLQTHAAGDSPL